MKKRIMFFLLFFTLIILPLQAKGADNNLISVSPKDVLFDVKNMKPGDWAIRNLTIKNKAGKQLNYGIAIEFQSGSKKLFNEMKIKIEHKGKPLAAGKLKDIRELDSQKLEAGGTEVLTFRLDFPPELGNEFQGLNSRFKIIVTAAEAGPLGGSDSIAVDGGLSGQKPGGVLPNTATNIFNLIITGMVLCGAGVIVQWWHRRRTSLRAD